MERIDVLRVLYKDAELAHPRFVVFWHFDRQKGRRHENGAGAVIPPVILYMCRILVFICANNFKFRSIDVIGGCL